MKARSTRAEPRATGALDMPNGQTLTKDGPRRYKFVVVLDFTAGRDLEVKKRRLDALLSGYTPERRAEYTTLQMTVPGSATARSCYGARFERAHSAYMKALDARRTYTAYKWTFTKSAAVKAGKEARTTHPRADVHVVEIAKGFTLSSVIGKDQPPQQQRNSVETPGDTVMAKPKTKTKMKMKTTKPQKKPRENRILLRNQPDPNTNGVYKTKPRPEPAIGAPGKFREALLRAALASPAGMPTLARMVGCSIITAQKHLSRLVAEKKISSWAGPRGALYGRKTREKS